MKKKTSNTEDYLAVLPADQRAALEKLRERILAAAPGAEEHFGYGLPGFKLNGHPLIYFGAAKAHCAIYGSVPAGIIEKLKGFDVSKGTIRFDPKRPIPTALVNYIVRAKAAAIEAKWPASSKNRTTRK